MTLKDCFENNIYFNPLQALQIGCSIIEELLGNTEPGAGLCACRVEVSDFEIRQAREVKIRISKAQCHCSENNVFMLGGGANDEQRQIYSIAVIMYFACNPEIFGTAASSRQDSSDSTPWKMTAAELECLRIVSPELHEVLSKAVPQEGENVITRSEFLELLKENINKVQIKEKLESQETARLVHDAKRHKLSKKPAGRRLVLTIAVFSALVTALSVATANYLSGFRLGWDTGMLDHYYMSKPPDDDSFRAVPLTVLYTENPQFDRETHAAVIDVIDRHKPSVIAIDYSLFQPCEDEASRRFFEVIGAAGAKIIMPNSLTVSDMLVNKSGFTPNRMLCSYLKKDGVRPAGEKYCEDFHSSFISVPYDSDGVVRRTWLYARTEEGRIANSLSLEAVLQHFSSMGKDASLTFPPPGRDGYVKEIGNLIPPIPVGKEYFKVKSGEQAAGGVAEAVYVVPDFWKKNERGQVEEPSNTHSKKYWKQTLQVNFSGCS